MTLDDELAWRENQKDKRDKEKRGICTACGCQKKATHKADREFCRGGGYVRCHSISCDEHSCPNCERLKA